MILPTPSVGGVSYDKRGDVATKFAIATFLADKEGSYRGDKLSWLTQVVVSVACVQAVF